LIVCTIAAISTRARVAIPLIIVAIVTGTIIAAIVVMMAETIIAGTIITTRIVIVSVPTRDCLQIAIAEFDLAASMFCDYKWLLAVLAPTSRFVFQDTCKVKFHVRLPFYFINDVLTVYVWHRSDNYVRGW